MGLRCPQHVYEEVRGDAESSALDRRENVLAKDRRDLAKARLTLLKLFPRIPSEDAEAVLAHAFLKGSGRVGRTTTLNDDQKFRAAVAAHIRHTKTPYESLLRQGRQSSRKEANAEVNRARVRYIIQAKLDEILNLWRPVTNASLWRDRPAVAPVRRASDQRAHLRRTSTYHLYNTSKSVPDGDRVRDPAVNASIHAAKMPKMRTRSFNALKAIIQDKTRIRKNTTSLRKRAARPVTTTQADRPLRYKNRHISREGAKR